MNGGSLPPFILFFRRFSVLPLSSYPLRIKKESCRRAHDGSHFTALPDSLKKTQTWHLFGIMRAMTKIFALVPMRHTSERVPGKNYRDMAGKPLYTYILETLLAVPEITNIVVDTDSPIILTRVGERFPTVIVLERPPHLRAGEIPMNEILLHTTAQVDADWYLQTHSTNPLIKPETISRAIQYLLSNIPAYDSLFGVTRLQTSLWNSLSLPINHTTYILLRTQNRPTIT